jgi:hypothetical protein
MQENELTLSTGDPATNSGRPVILQLHGSFEAFGVVFDYLSRTDPFTRFQVGHFSSIIRQQLKIGHHLVAMDGKTVVGYVGWILTTKEIGDRWQEDHGKLTPVAEGKADSAALTVVASRDRSILLRLIRGARTLNPGKRVYFKREYDDGGKTTRKASVDNVTRPAAMEAT